MTKTNAEAKTAAAATKAKAAAKPKLSAADADKIVQSSAVKGSDEHMIKAAGGETYTFPNAKWRGSIRDLCAVGASYKAAKAAVQALPAPKLARGLNGRDAPHSSKAVGDAAAKGSNKADKVQAVAKAKADAKVKRAEAKKQGTPDDSRKIVDVVPNPKRPGTDSYDRFAKYKKGMTVAQALAAGVTRADIKWDSDRNFIKLAD